jgi:hypothetical protein
LEKLKNIKQLEKKQRILLFLHLLKYRKLQANYRNIRPNMFIIITRRRGEDFQYVITCYNTGPQYVGLVDMADARHLLSHHFEHLTGENKSSSWV